MRKSILFAAVSVLLTGSALAQGDTADAATGISDVGTHVFDTTGSSSSGFTGAAMACDSVNHDNFFQWTATADGDYTFSLCNSVLGDTKLSLYSGIGLAATCIDSDDDTCGLRTDLTVNGVLMGDTILVQAGSYSATASGEGSVTLDVTVFVPPVLPMNDDCGGATLIGGTGDFAFDPTNATESTMVGDGACAVTTYARQDVFFVWTAASDGDFTFETQDSAIAYDSKMVVYSGSTCGPTAPCLASDDDGGDTFASLISVMGVTAGDEFIIQVGAFSNFTTVGPNVLTVTQAPNGSDCSLGLPIAGAGAFAYDTTGNISTGFSEGACTSVNQDTFFVWTADQDGDWTIDTFATGHDTKMAIFAGVDCAATCVGSNDDAGGTLQSEVTLVGVTAGDSFLIQVGGFGSNEGAGTLTVNAPPPSCSAADEDALEENDTCMTAVPIMTGLTTGLYTSDMDTDFYSISIPAGEILTVTLNQVSGDTDFDVLLSDCVTSLGLPFGSWSVNNTGAVSLDLVFEAMNFNGGQDCSLYDLDISIVPDPCGPAADDAFEDNDDCATALPLGDGTYPGLFVSDADGDFYAFCVGNGDTVSVDIFFDNSIEDLDIFLRAASSLGCGGDHGGADLLAEGWSASDDESLTWTNTTGADLDVILQVDAFGADCNNYDMVIAGANTCAPSFGTMYCTAEMNSTGVISTIVGTGSDIAANNTFGLLASGLPDGEFGYFIGSFGQTQVNNPGGSNGNLCVGGGVAIARFLPTLGAIAGGQIAGSVDLTNVPLPPSFAGMILAGDTFNFQLWHREGGPLSGMSNFSPGLEVLFQ